MTGETRITVVGNLTADPELRYTQGGLAVAGFTVAATPRSFDRATNEWKDGDTLFQRCSAWRELGERAAASLHKGDRVIVTGTLRSNTYEKQDGSKGYSVDLDVDEVGPSLRYATAVVTRATRTSSTPADSSPPAGVDPDTWSTLTTGAPAPAAF